MDVNQDRIQALVDNPAETLNIELKNWIDPTTVEGQSKIVRAALALRNRDGGELVIGFHDKTRLPDTNNIPEDVRKTFHPDAIQGLISKYASEVFEVAIGYGERQNQLYPVIIVPPGVKTVVAAKADLRISGKSAIKLGAVYFRSLHANGTVSTSEARPGDWREIMEICLNNREADFAGFFRRQLAGTTPDALKQLVSAFFEPRPSKDRPCELAQRLLDEGYQRLLLNIEDRKKEGKFPDDFVVKYGSWSSGVVICGDVPSRVADQSFLHLIAASNPRYTGWPTWLDSRHFNETSDHPRNQQGGWETLIVTLGRNVLFDEVEFTRIDPRGKFYLWRVLQDDLGERVRGLPPLKLFDPSLTVARVAEVMAVGLAFARAMGCHVETTTLAFAFKWTRLRGRTISSWAEPARINIGTFVANDDEAISCVEVPLETSPSALTPFVIEATRELLAKFNGFAMVPNVVEQLVERLLARRL
jgi:hypothetical protein